MLISTSNAQLRITEVMSSGGTADWFELTNLGTSPVTLTGYKMDDGSFSYANSLALNGVTSIASGESVIFGESGSATFAADYRTFWGIANTVQVGTYSGSGAGLSSNGDGVVVFDELGAEVNRVSFGAATAGSSFFWGYNADGTINTSYVGVLSTVGVVEGQQSFASANLTWQRI